MEWGGGLSNSGTCPAIQTCPSFVPTNLFILSPPSGVCLSPRNQGIGEEGEEDPELTPPLNSREKREGERGRKKNLIPPSLARKEAKGDNYN